MKVILRATGVTVPLAGELDVLNRRPTDVAAALSETLETYVEAPYVTVSVTERQAARFFVIGQVNQSGAFPLLAPTTVGTGAVVGVDKLHALVCDMRLILIAWVDRAIDIPTRAATIGADDHHTICIGQCGDVGPSVPTSMRAARAVQ